MIDEDKKLIVLRIKIFVAVLFLIMFTIILINVGKKVGKSKLTILTSPDGAIVLINDKPYSPGAHYLKPGKYKIEAKMEGFSDDIVNVDLGKGSEEVYLLPEPQSDITKLWLKDNPKIQQERESIAAKKKTKKSTAIEDSSPIIKFLPFSTLRDGPFQMDYGPSDKRENGVFIEISNSTPEGRVGAVDWLYRHGQDPTDLEIQYIDYNNPFVQKGGSR